MKILMVSAEAAPFAKVGGMGDAVPALARALAGKKHDVGIVMPRYYSTNRNALIRHMAPLGVPMADGTMWCGVYETTLPGSQVPVWMLDREDLFGRDGLYGPDGSRSWPDNARRFAFLSSAAFALSQYLNRIPDILHAHDWPTAPMAWILKAMRRRNEFTRTASVLTVHNLGYQGVFPPSVLPLLPFPGSAGKPIVRSDAVNFLAMGLDASDIITTVSPTYARDIRKKELSEGLDDLIALRSKSIFGILNGIDEDEWNPSTDPALSPHNYSRTTMDGKARLKERLQREAGLPTDSRVPLFGMISRLTGQKGVDLLTKPGTPALQLIREGRAQLVILGSGEKRYEDALRSLAGSYPEHCSVRIAFSEPFSRLIEAGSDFFLMPSRYEPCGLNQMYSLRYGTLPIVRKTGGLADTVVDINAHPFRGNGFVFLHSNGRELNGAMNRAAILFKRPRALMRTRRRAMARRFNWGMSAAAYEAVYRRARRVIP